MKHILKSVILCLSLVSINACSGTGTDSMKIPENWIQIEAGDAFTLMAPPGTKYNPEQGIDSFVGAIRSDQFELIFDYGLYSDPLDVNSDSHPGKAQKMLTVDNRPARLVYNTIPDNASDHPWFIGMHVPDIKKTAIGTVALTITCFPASRDDYELIEKIFRTIKFSDQ